MRTNCQCNEEPCCSPQHSDPQLIKNTKNSKLKNVNPHSKNINQNTYADQRSTTQTKTGPPFPLSARLSALARERASSPDKLAFPPPPSLSASQPFAAQGRQTAKAIAFPSTRHQKTATSPLPRAVKTGTARLPQRGASTLQALPLARSTLSSRRSRP